MSAWLLDAAHLGALVKFALSDRMSAPYWRGAPLTEESAPDLLDALAVENARSYNWRYRSEGVSPVACHPDLAVYADLTALEALKAISCYEYQSCEHDGWEGSAPQKFCEALRHHACRRLPGWDTAQGWPVEADTVNMDRISLRFLASRNQ